MITCSICNRKFKNRRSISKHLQQTHKFTLEKIQEYFANTSDQDKRKDTETYIQCKICGHWFKSLQFHIKRHDITSNDYKEKFGSLFSVKCIEINSQKKKEYYKTISLEEKKKRGKRVAEIRKQNNTNHGGRKKGFRHTEEWKNEHQIKMKQNPPFKGKSHSLESRIKMGQDRKDITGENNPFKKSLDASESKRQEHKNRCKNIWNSRDEDYRNSFGEKLSESIAKSQLFQTEIFHKRYKCGFLALEKCGKIFYRSSWEKLVCLFLNECDYVKEFKLEPFTISYINNKGNKRWFRIDFFVTLENNLCIIFEIKPECLLTYNNNAEKIIGYKNHCKNNNIQFKLITEEDLGNLQEIILNSIRGEYYVS